MIERLGAWLRQRPVVWVLAPGIVLMVVGLVVFGVVLEAVLDAEELWALDQAVLAWMVDHRSDALTAVLAAITFVTGPVVLPIIVAVGCGVWVRVRREWWRPSLLALAMIASTLVGLAVKGVVGRARPPAETMFIPGAETTASFPSGHTLGTATLLLVAGYLDASRNPTRGRIVGWAVATAVGTGLVALSRLYLGYHFLSDVLAASALAVAVLGVVCAVDRWHVWRRRDVPATERLPVRP